eukprot:gene10375-biopygen19804
MRATHGSVFDIAPLTFALPGDSSRFAEYRREGDGSASLPHPPHYSTPTTHTKGHLTDPTDSTAVQERQGSTGGAMMWAAPHSPHLETRGTHFCGGRKVRDARGRVDNPPTLENGKILGNGDTMGKENVCEGDVGRAPPPPPAAPRGAAAPQPRHRVDLEAVGDVARAQARAPPAGSARGALTHVPALPACLDKYPPSRLSTFLRM